MNAFYGILAIASIYLISQLNGMPSELQIAKDAEKRYCENVVLWHHNKNGHPDYREIFDSVCKPEYRL